MSRPLRVVSSVVLAALVVTAAALGPVQAAAAHEVVTVHPYRIEVDGPVVSDADAFARRVADILTDPRGWSLDGRLRFEEVADGAATTIVLAAPEVVEAAADGCSAAFSCRVGDRVLINDRNWREATPAWRAAGGDLGTYREYLVNHEVGHVLGFDHHDCPAPDAPAPVMQQQSMDLAGCEPHGWPDADERRALADRVGLPAEAVQGDRVQADGTLTDPDARRLARRLAAGRMLEVRTMAVLEPVVGWARTTLGVLVGVDPDAAQPEREPAPGADGR